MSGLFKSRKVKTTHDEGAAMLNKQTAAIDQFTNNPAYNYQKDQLSNIASGNYGATMGVQAAKNEAARAAKQHKYQFNAGAGAFNANPQLQHAMRMKQLGDIDERYGLAIPGIVQNQADNSSQFIQNAHYNTASGYSDAGNKAMQVYRYTYKPSIFSSVLGAAAPFLNFIPGVGPALSAGASALSGLTAGSEAGIQSGGGAGSTYTPSYSFGRQTAQQAMQQNREADAESSQPATRPRYVNAAHSIAGELSDPKSANSKNPQENPFKRFKSFILGN